MLFFYINWKRGFAYRLAVFIQYTNITTFAYRPFNLLVTRCINKLNIQQCYVLPTLYLCVV
jgi:hypothetical protein